MKWLYLDGRIIGSTDFPDNRTSMAPMIAPPRIAFSWVVNGGTLERMSALKARQERFVQEYFANGCNASAAYRASGYRSIKNVDKQSSKVLNRPGVRAEIERRVKMNSEMAELKLGEALDILAGIARKSEAKDADRISAVMSWAKVTGQAAPAKHELTTKEAVPSKSILQLIIEGIEGVDRAQNGIPQDARDPSNTN